MLKLSIWRILTSNLTSSEYAENLLKTTFWFLTFNNMHCIANVYLQRCSVCDPVKIFFTSKFSLCTLPQKNGNLLTCWKYWWDNWFSFGYRAAIELWSHLIEPNQPPMNLITHLNTAKKHDMTKSEGQGCWLVDWFITSIALLICNKVKIQLNIPWNNENSLKEN